MDQRMFPRGGLRASARSALACGLLTFFVAGPVSALAFVHPAALRYGLLTTPPTFDAVAELHCLALNVYHEARGESEAGKFAVAAVTMNRVASRRFPDTVCAVVWQRGQFSWTEDGRPDTPYEQGAWREAVKVASLVYKSGRPSNVGAATYYHARNVTPGWARGETPVAKVGRHIFYAPYES